jgi:hypothetical protein
MPIADDSVAVRQSTVVSGYAFAFQRSNTLAFFSTRRRIHCVMVRLQDVYCVHNNWLKSATAVTVRLRLNSPRVVVPQQVDE